MNNAYFQDGIGLTEQVSNQVNAENRKAVMHKWMGLDFAIPADYLNSAVTVSLLSVLVLVGLFFYLNWYTGRRYFRIWTLGWVFYAVWLAMGPGAVNASPFQVMVKYWCVGASAALLFWGSVQFLKMPARPLLVCLFVSFLLVWSYVGAYYLKNPLQIRAPIFGIIGLASLVTAFSFYRVRKHREYLGAGLLTFGFVLWGVYLAACPFFSFANQMVGTGFLVSAVLQLFIAVSMIILVLEEARAANELMLSQIRAYQSEAMELEAEMVREESQYQGIFDRTALNNKLRLAYGDLRVSQEKGLQRERMQALAQMSRGIAHDINNALTPVLGYANLLLREPQELPENVLNYIRSIKSGGEKIAECVLCIRDFYRTREGKDVLMATDLNALAEEAVDSRRAQWQKSDRADGAKIHFRTHFEPALPRVMGKQSEMSEAIEQLLSNGIEAMPQGGTLELRTGVMRGADKGSAARVFVEILDTGIGMDEETRKRCFEPFFSTKDGHGAKGLGLSRVFGIMQRHEGDVEVESKPGKGTVARMVFPSMPGATPEPAVPAPEAGVLRPLKILCIDDEPPILDVLNILLTHSGHQVEVASDGHAGLEMFDAARAVNAPFDVVLTDLGMPKLDGYEVAKMIKAESSTTPVIMLTGWGGIMQAEGHRPENIDVVLSKPPEVSELFAALQTVAGKNDLELKAH